MYSPLNHWKATSGGLRVGIVGIGGLGQMGVRMAKAMGNTVRTK
jgi:D-arabinose 1-dehydrogenase-like Zn-dependent alcohol dehydrogenase